jgi:metallo-beta-lactamase class B
MMTSISSKTAALLTLAFALAASALQAQAPQAPAAPPKPDTPTVTQHVDLARKAAATEWTQAVEFICKVNPDRANRVDDPLIAPTKIFDNVYAIGRTGTVVYTITTSAGIVLIDAGYADQLETVLLPGLKAVGLDPNNVRYILLGHGHGDHFGGAAYFQDKGARVRPPTGTSWKRLPQRAAAARPLRPVPGHRSVMSSRWKGRASSSAT